MNGISYELPQGESAEFAIEYDREGRIASLRHPQDPCHTDWVKGKAVWGSVTCPYPFTVCAERAYTERGTLRERYIFTNTSEFDVYTSGTELSVRVVYPDYYTDAEICMEQCCDAHLWCMGSSSYIMALRMGGGAYNLGLVLTQGSLKGYSVERDEAESSNERGCFLLHPENFHLLPGASCSLEWELFWFADKEDFRARLHGYEGFADISAEQFVLLGDESVRFQARIGGAASGDEKARVFRDGREIPCSWEDGCAQVLDRGAECGEYTYEIVWRGKRSYARFLKYPALDALAGARCRFIAEKQQCADRKSRLNGAYLIYDNEEQTQYYSHLHDHNAGRERVGMGALMALYLQRHRDAALAESLDRYLAFVLRELCDAETGEVFNDAGRNQDWKRLYNYPWVAVLFLETYRLKGDERYLTLAARVLFAYYRDGGAGFYAIGIPMSESVTLLREAGRQEEAERLLALYEEHGRAIAARGRRYPAHEVKYEQSIVAPAAYYMCELYRLTGKELYREAAKEQLAALDLFEGFQPDYHCYETAIRHWDGFWFGKSRLYGDTFPHYWSALSGLAFLNTAGFAGTDAYERKAKAALRGVLSLVRPDGSASCAYIYPQSVNGRPAATADPWANDQDWGLYFALKYSGGQTAV